MQVIAKTNVLSLKLLTAVLVHAASMPALEMNKLACCARTKRHGSFHAQSYSDVIDVVDIRSFEVKKEITFDIRRPCIHMPLRRTKHARSIDAR
jgi:hypothetical protein